MTRFLGWLAHSRLGGTIFAPLYIGRLRSEHNVEALIREINFRRHPRLSLRAVRALARVGDERAIGPLLGALAEGARRFDEVFAVTFGPLEPVVRADWSARLNTAWLLLRDPRRIEAESHGLRRALFVLVLMLVGGWIGFDLWRTYAPTFPNNEGAWWQVLEILQPLGVVADGVLLGFFAARVLMPWFVRAEIAVVRRIKGALIALFRPLEPTLTMIRGVSSTRQLQALDDRFAAIVAALVHVGTPAVEPLINALHHQRWTVRQHAADALGDIRDPRAIEPLAEALHDVNLQLYIRAVELLGEVGAPPVEPLLEALGARAPHLHEVARRVRDLIRNPRAGSAVMAGLHNNYWSMVLGAAEALVRRDDLRTVDLVIAALKDRYWMMLVAMAEALAKIGAPAPLIEALQAEDRLVRRAAAQALGRAEDVGMGAEPVVQGTLNNK